MMRSTLLLLLLSAAVCLTGHAQDQDSAFIAPPVDSTVVDSLAQVPDSASAEDSLSDIEKAKQMIHARMQEHQEAIKREPSLSYFDSAIVYFTSPRMNYASDIERSYYRDAGDFLHFDPSYFIVDYQGTPMRKTVQPFGLRSNRLNFVVDGQPLSPFEHVPEPDGLVDVNDLPTAMARNVYALPGPVGQLLGGTQAVATLVTLPKKPDSDTPESAFLADQGSYEFNHVRGRYSKTFAFGREIDLSVAYRNSDGAKGYPDDSYHYTGRLFWPIGADYGVRLSGQLYDREGWLKARSTVDGYPVKRKRIDRSAEIAVERLNTSHTIRSEAGYRYLKQGSHLDQGYTGRFDIFGDGIFAAREWLAGSSILRAEIRGDKEIYTDGYNDWDRHTAAMSVQAVSMTPGWRYGVAAEASYVSTQRVLPGVSLNLMRDSDQSLVLLSIGYTERAPSLHELNLRFQRAHIYSTEELDYGDQGNPDLGIEKQAIANATVELGKPSSSLRLSLTGGAIIDAIEWQHRTVSISLTDSYLLFSPINTDVNFLSTTIQKKFPLLNLFTLSAGGSYHWVDYDAFERKPYSPDYQLFGSGEFHAYWPQKIMDLFAYGELVYVGEYDGYKLQGLGKSLTTNVKLSFRIKGFRFHVTIQNALGTLIESHEYWWSPRHSYYGLTWNFLD